MAAFSSPYTPASKTAPYLKASDAKKPVLKGPFRFRNPKDLGDLLYASTSLTDLDLSFNHLDGHNLADQNSNDMELFSEALGASKILLYLDLTMNNLQAEDICLISGALKVNQSLIHLNLAGNTFEEEGAKCLAEALEVNSELKYLNINSISTNVHGFASIFDALRNNTTLEDLKISNDNLVQAVAFLARMLSVNKSLRALNIHYCGIRDVGFPYIRDGLNANTTLQTINLGHNGLTVVSAPLLREVLETNKSLVQLDITDNLFSVEGIKIIAEGLRVNTTLRRFIIECSNAFHGPNMIKTYDIGPQGIIALVDAADNLEYLDISGNTAGLEGMKAVAQMLMKSSTIRYLDLSNTSPTDEGVRIVAEVLGQNSSLSTLKFGSSDLTETSTGYLIDAAEHTTVSILVFNYKTARYDELKRKTGGRLWNLLTRLVNY